MRYTLDEFTTMGREAGAAAGSWIVDGNTSAETAAAILAGYEDGDPEVLDLCPAPLSGEWAGESIPELFGYWPDDEEMTAYEVAFCEAFWVTVCESARVAAS